MIIAKYIRREFLYTVITITALLVLVGLCNQGAIILNKSMQGDLAKNAVVYIVAFSMPFFLSILLPIGVFIAAYLVFTRLYSEQEMIIIQMGGINKFRIIKFLWLPLVFISLFAMFVNMWFAPTVLRYRDILMDKAQLVNAITMIAEGHFRVIAGGKYVIYVQEANAKDKEFSHVFVAEQPKELNLKEQNHNKKNRWDIFVSKGGHEAALSEFNNNKAIVMTDGYQYQGIPGQGDFYKLKFSDYAFELPKQEIAGKLRGRATSTMDLIRSASVHDLSELHARLNLVIAPFVLTILALAMSNLAPRQSRFIKLLPAAIIVLIYYNFLLASEEWIERGYLSIYFGALWLHVLVISFASYLLYRQK